MMIGTAMIAVTPSYATAGLLAPILIVVARMVQGVSAGGEFGTATAFLAEQIQPAAVSSGVGSSRARG